MATLGSMEIDNEDTNDKVFLLLGIMLIPLAAGLLFSILLIYGSVKERKNFLLAWIIYNGIILGGSCILLIVVVIVAKEPFLLSALISIRKLISI